MEISFFGEEQLHADRGRHFVMHGTDDKDDALAQHSRWQIVAFNTACRLFDDKWPIECCPCRHIPAHHLARH
jgi:hypothetical protein